MPGLVIGGRVFPIPPLEVVSYMDERKLKLIPGEDMRRRITRWIRQITLHNTKNIATKVKPGKGPETNLEQRIARLWSTDGRNAGAHLAVDWDCTVSCHADLLYDAAYHAGQINEVSIGIEIYEDWEGHVYEEQLRTVCVLVQWLCNHFRIQRQIHTADDTGVLIRQKAGGKDMVGVFGHCHAYAGKKNDPGIHVFQMLRDEFGFMEFDFNPEILGVSADDTFWTGIQTKLNYENGFDLERDGVPGPATCDALQAVGYKDGLWYPPEDPSGDAP